MLPPDGNGTGGISGNGAALFMSPIERPATHAGKPIRPLWSKDAGYPHPRRVIHTRPHHTAKPRTHTSKPHAKPHNEKEVGRHTRQNALDRLMPERVLGLGIGPSHTPNSIKPHAKPITKKEDPP